MYFIFHKGGIVTRPYLLQSIPVIPVVSETAHVALIGGGRNYMSQGLAPSSTCERAIDY